jgi:hypothetical protein
MVHHVSFQEADPQRSEEARAPTMSSSTLKLDAREKEREREREKDYSEGSNTAHSSSDDEDDDDDNDSNEETVTGERKPEEKKDGVFWRVWRFLAKIMARLEITPSKFLVMLK